MKTTLLAAVAALALGIAGTAHAQVPCGTAYGGWSNSTSYYYPTTSYGYGVSQPYGVYSSYPQYGSSWNTPVYRAPSYSYDPVHGDYHVNNGRSFNHWNNGFGNSFPQYRTW